MKAAVLLIGLLAGCASGIRVSDEEAVACRNEGCAVFTERELMGLVGKAMAEGYRRGWRDANVQAGRDL